MRWSRGETIGGLQSPPREEGWLRRRRRRGGRSRAMLRRDGPPRRFAPPLLTRMGLRLAFPVILLLLTSCQQQMADQGRIEPLEESSFFADHRSARPIPTGAVARGFLEDDASALAATTFPFEITLATLARGRDRYDIFCSPCHDRVGGGNGMAVRRGFRSPPPTFNMDRLREAPVGHFYDVITNGFGAMNDYAAQIKPRDRWAIVAYIRVLQFSQNANVRDLPAEDRRELERLPR